MKHLRVHSMQGFSIIELMIAMLLSLVLLAGVGQIYVSSKQSYRVTEEIGRMQENSRFAMDVLTKEIRMAGFSPCPPTDEVAITLNAGLPADTYDFGNGAIIGYEAGGTFASSFPATGNGAGARVADSDGFMVKRGGDTTYSIESHVETSAQFKVVDANGLEDGDVLMVCDANNTAIFQTSNVTFASGTVVHPSGNAGMSPGNCSKGLGFPTDCGSANGNGYTYEDDAVIVKFISTIYYVGVSSDGTGRSLYRQRLLENSGATLGAGAAVELIDGIETLQLLYALDTDGDTQAERYVSADNVTAAGSCGATPCTWNNVIGVRLGLLMATQNQVASSTDTKSYNIAGNVFDDTDHGNDKRLRTVYTSTVKIRNRGAL
jgi:type IV pilus assembly protein PilW